MFFILEIGIFRNFGIWDIGIYFGIRVKILGYGIFWTVYFGIWDIAYPPPPPPNHGILFVNRFFCFFFETELKPRLHLPRSSYDFSVCDFLYDFKTS